MSLTNLPSPEMDDRNPLPHNASNFIQPVSRPHELIELETKQPTLPADGKKQAKTKDIKATLESMWNSDIVIGTSKITFDGYIAMLKREGTLSIFNGLAQLDLDFSSSCDSIELQSCLFIILLPVFERQLAGSFNSKKGKKSLELEISKCIQSCTKPLFCDETTNKAPKRYSIRHTDEEIKKILEVMLEVVSQVLKFSINGTSLFMPKNTLENLWTRLSGTKEKPGLFHLTAKAYNPPSWTFGDSVYTFIVWFVFLPLVFPWWVSAEVGQEILKLVDRTVEIDITAEVETEIKGPMPSRTPSGEVDSLVFQTLFSLEGTRNSRSLSQRFETRNQGYCFSGCCGSRGEEEFEKSENTRTLSCNFSVLVKYGLDLGSLGSDQVHTPHNQSWCRKMTPFAWYPPFVLALVVIGYAPLLVWGIWAGPEYDSKLSAIEANAPILIMWTVQIIFGIKHIEKMQNFIYSQTHDYNAENVTKAVELFSDHMMSFKDDQCFSRVPVKLRFKETDEIAVEAFIEKREHAEEKVVRTIKYSGWAKNMTFKQLQADLHDHNFDLIHPKTNKPLPKQAFEEVSRGVARVGGGGLNRTLTMDQINDDFQWMTREHFGNNLRKNRVGNCMLGKCMRSYGYPIITALIAILIPTLLRIRYGDVITSTDWRDDVVYSTFVLYNILLFIPILGIMNNWISESNVAMFQFEAINALLNTKTGGNYGLPFTLNISDPSQLVAWISIRRTLFRSIKSSLQSILLVEILVTFLIIGSGVFAGSILRDVIKDDTDVFASLILGTFYLSVFVFYTILILLFAAYSNQIMNLEAIRSLHAELYIAGTKKLSWEKKIGDEKETISHPQALMKKIERVTSLDMMVNAAIHRIENPVDEGLYYKVFGFAVTFELLTLFGTTAGGTILTAFYWMGEIAVASF